MKMARSASVLRPSLHVPCQKAQSPSPSGGRGGARISSDLVGVLWEAEPEEASSVSNLFGK